MSSFFSFTIVEIYLPSFQPPRGGGGGGGGGGGEGVLLASSRMFYLTGSSSNVIYSFKLVVNGCFLFITLINTICGSKEITQ